MYSWAGRPLRAVELLERTENRQREVDDKLYDEYSSERRRLIEHLHYKLGNDLETSIYIAQRILDRIIFVAFCEDRDLLREKTLKSVYSTVPRSPRRPIRRWRSFLELFRAMDQGHKNMPYLEVGFNGGLFKEDPRIDDLQLDDDWTEFFNHVGDYDFRDEVNVEVLGHLFEKSVAEIEKLRSGGLYRSTERTRARKRHAEIGRTQAVRNLLHPADFTRLIVEETVRAVVRERFDAVLAAHDLSREESEAEEPSPKLAAYWRDCLAALRNIKVCDPACGSGKFLIAAYDVLEEEYTRVVDHLVLHDGPDADDLADEVPNMILADNLYGADVSQQAVEITQLALWLRSAQRGKRLADLSQNVVWANSLVTDPAVHDKAMEWPRGFRPSFRTNRVPKCLPSPLGEGRGRGLGRPHRIALTLSSPKGRGHGFGTAASIASSAIRPGNG